MVAQKSIGRSMEFVKDLFTDFIGTNSYELLEHLIIHNLRGFL
jgi:hypothetical protein